MSKIRKEWSKSQPIKVIAILNAEGKRLLIKTFYLIFYHDAHGKVIYFSIAEKFEIPSNHVRKMLIGQINTSDEDDIRLRLRLEK